MSDRKKRINWKAVLTLITFVAMAGAVYALRDQIGTTIENLKDANLWLVILLVPIAGFNHLMQAKMYQLVFRILGTRFRTKSMWRLSMELNFVNNIFPSAGVSGFSYLSIRMKDEDVSGGKTTLVQLMRFIMLFVSFQLLLGIGLIFLAIGGDANDFVLLIAGSLATLLFIGTTFVTYIVGSEKRIKSFMTVLTQVINKIIYFVRPKHPETINVSRVQQVFSDLHKNYMKIKKDFGQLKKPLLFALFANFAEVSAIFVVFAAFGIFVNPGAIIVAYAVANFAGIVSILPGGVGVYEALMTGVFAAAGVPAAISIPVVLAYRVVNMSIQLPTGYFFYQKNLHAKDIPTNS